MSTVPKEAVTDSCNKSLDLRYFIACLIRQHAKVLVGPKMVDFHALSIYCCAPNNLMESPLKQVPLASVAKLTLVVATFIKRQQARVKMLLNTITPPVIEPGSLYSCESLMRLICRSLSGEIKTSLQSNAIGCV
jgi:hypothetical protein